MKRFTVILAVALVATACTNSGGAERAPGYFDALRPVARSVTGSVAEVGDAFDQLYESDVMRTTRLTDLRIGSDLAIAADRVSRLDPGEAYAADHERYLTTIDAIRDVYRAFDEAVALGDTARAAVAATGMEAAAGLGFATLSTAYCGRVTFDMRLCDRPTDPDEYEAVLYTVMLDLAAGYTPLLRPAPAALDPDETLVYLSFVDVEAAARLQRVEETLSATEPPAAFLTDHTIVIGMLQVAATLHAAGRADSDIPATFCDAADMLSTETADLAEVFLADDDLDCASR